jgi:hypothetical protein
MINDILAAKYINPKTQKEIKMIAEKRELGMEDEMPELCRI